MWRNPVTEKQIRVLTDDWGVKEEVTCPAGETRSIIGWFKVITVSLYPSTKSRSASRARLTPVLAHQQVRLHAPQRFPPTSN